MQQTNYQYGDYLNICGLRKGEPFIVLGPNRYFFLFALAIVNIASTIMLVLMAKHPEAYVFYTVHLVILIYFDIVWISAAIVNPGIMLKQTKQQYGCMHCRYNNMDLDESLAIPQHCKKCKVCIEGRSYHCKLIGGCVGHGNQIVYHFFLLGIVLYVIDFLSTAPYIYYL